MSPELTILLYVIGTFILMIVLFNGLFYGAMYMAIPKRKLKKIIELGNLKKGMTVLDLGCGYGRIMFEVAKSEAEVIGYEVDRAKAFWASRQIIMKEAWNATVVHDNLLHADLSNADVVYAYLSPPLMAKIGEKARKEMKIGARIISVEHKIPNWTPIFSDEKERIYMYEKRT